MVDSPTAKRRKVFSGNEVLLKLQESENDVQAAVDKIIEELCPFDVNDEAALQIEDRMQRLERVTSSLTAKVYRLKNSLKTRVYRHNREMLDDKMVSCSQYSLFDSQGPDLCTPEENQTNIRPQTQRKKPLNGKIGMKWRRDRVADKRETLRQWAKEEEVTVSELLGYFLYVESYPKNGIWRQRVGSCSWEAIL